MDKKAAAVVLALSSEVLFAWYFSMRIDEPASKRRGVVKKPFGPDDHGQARCVARRAWMPHPCAHHVPQHPGALQLSASDLSGRSPRRRAPVREKGQRPAQTG